MAFSVERRARLALKVADEGQALMSTDADSVAGAFLLIGCDVMCRWVLIDI